jgi:hypothetical protein
MPPQSGQDLGSFVALVFGYLPTIVALWFSWMVIVQGEFGGIKPVSRRWKKDNVSGIFVLIYMWFFCGALQFLLMWVFGFGVFDNSLLSRF